VYALRLNDAALAYCCVALFSRFWPDPVGTVKAVVRARVSRQCLCATACVFVVIIGDAADGHCHG
jgi:hypothetical protein